MTVSASPAKRQSGSVTPNSGNGVAISMRRDDVGNVLSSVRVGVTHSDSGDPDAPVAPTTLHLANDSQHDESYHHWSAMHAAGCASRHPRLRASCEPVIEPLMHGSADDAAGLVGRGGGSSRDCHSTGRVSAPISAGVGFPPMRTPLAQQVLCPHYKRSYCASITAMSERLPVAARVVIQRGTLRSMDHCDNGRTCL